MTGKELKLFAAQLHDDADVEIQHQYTVGWGELRANNLRAILLVEAQTVLTQPTNSTTTVV